MKMLYEELLVNEVDDTNWNYWCILVFVKNLKAGEKRRVDESTIPRIGSKAIA